MKNFILLALVFFSLTANSTDWNISINGASYIVSGDITTNSNYGDQIANIKIAEISDPTNKFNIFVLTDPRNYIHVLSDDLCKLLGYEKWLEVVFSAWSTTDVSAILTNDGHKTAISFNVPELPLQPLRYLECFPKSK